MHVHKLRSLSETVPQTHSRHIARLKAAAETAEGVARAARARLNTAIRTILLFTFLGLLGSLYCFDWTRGGLIVFLSVSGLNIIIVAALVRWHACAHRAWRDMAEAVKAVPRWQRKRAKLEDELRKKAAALDEVMRVHGQYPDLASVERAWAKLYAQIRALRAEAGIAQA